MNWIELIEEMTGDECEWAIVIPTPSAASEESGPAESTE